MSKDKNINSYWNTFWKEAKDKAIKKGSKFFIQPVSSIDFFNKWTNTPLFPKQQEIVNAAFDENYQNISQEYHEFVEALGKRAGKDYTIANLLNYLVYFLLCLNNPQEYLGIKSGEPIDIVNVSFDEEQAKTVFFDKFKKRLESTVNPETGKNFFEERGMNLNRDIQKSHIIFPKNIRAFSLNCFPYKTPILTKQGYIPIGKIVNKKLKVKIASYNFKNKKIIYNNIKDYFCIDDKKINWYKIEFDFNYSTKYRGKHIVCTNDHKVYVKNKGFIKAENLKIEDTVLNIKSFPNFTETKIKKIIPNYKNYTKDKQGWKKNYLSTSKKYCIDVGGSHTIFANGVLVGQSVKFKAEGKNIVFAVFDEIGSFRFDKAEGIRKHIKSTAKATASNFYKLFYISFLTDANDYMATLIDRAEKKELTKTHFLRAATWEVRSKENTPKKLLKYAVTKETFKEDYEEDEETAMLMYECKIPKIRKNNFIKRPEKVIQCIGSINIKGEKIFRPDPRIENDQLWIYDTDLKNAEFEPWFKPNFTFEIFKLEQLYETNPSTELENLIKTYRERHRNSEYYCHLDLSRGVEDCASVVLGHKYFVLDKPKIYIDLVIQIKAKKDNENTQEIDMTNILYFVLRRLHNKRPEYNGLGFNIKKTTADGWNSALFLNLCKKENIETEFISLERNTAPYDTSKDFIYNQGINFYFYPPLIREYTELIITPNKKIDHPRYSKRRLKEEGIGNGCFHPKTKIITCSNKTISIKDLSKNFKDEFVFALNINTLRIEPCKIKKVWITKTVKNLIEITLDNNKKIITTPNHKFLTRLNKYKEAKDLKINESLMPFYQRNPQRKSDYFLLKSLQNNKWYYTHKYLIGKENSNLKVHHKDCNKLNNNPSNLKSMTHSEHCSLHGKLEFKNKPNKVKKMRIRAKQVCNSESFKKQQSKRIKKTLYKMKIGEIKRVCWMKRKTKNDFRVKKFITAGAKARRKQGGSWCSGLTKQDSPILKKLAINLSLKQLGFNIEQKKESIINYYINDYKSPNQIGIILNCSEMTIRRALKRWKIFDIKHSKKIHKLNIIKSKKYNHQVKNIKNIKLINPIEVYDLELDNPNLHAFALNAGVFVHNSKDLTDGCAGLCYSATKEADIGKLSYGAITRGKTKKRRIKIR